jgi:dTDP-4-dehydrorhamnose reductase
VFSRICETRGLDYDANDLFEFDICDPQAVRQALTDRRPWAVVNAAGFASAAQAGRNPERCRLENCIAPEVLGSACSDLGIQMLTFSSDQVFDGRLGRPYVEADAPNPTSAFGAAKADAERRVLDCCDRVIIVRAGELFGTGPGHDFLSSVLSTLEAGREFVLSEERLITPAYLPDVVHRSLDLLIDGERGIWHLANAGAISRGEFARGAAVRAGLPPTLVIDCEDRGASTELASERGPLLPPLASALDRFFVECRSA